MKTPAEFRSAALRIEEQLRSLPEVRGVAMSMGRPGRKPVQAARPIEVDVASTGPFDLSLDHYRVRPSFFEFYGLRALRGRLLRNEDAADAVVVSERMATLLWPEADSIGRSFRRSSIRYRVVGVVSELTFPSLGSRLEGPEFYSAFEPQEFFFFQLRCRTECPPVSVFNDAVLEAFPASRVESVRLEDEFAAELIQPRRTAVAGLMFGSLALLTVAAGLFSVLSFAVGERRQEFGLRAALGAGPATLRSVVITQAARIVVIGVPVGAFIGWSTLRGLSALWYDVTVLDPAAWLLTVGVIGIVSLAGAWGPSRSAARTSPLNLLRGDSR